MPRWLMVLKFNPNPYICSSFCRGNWRKVLPLRTSALMSATSSGNGELPNSSSICFLGVTCAAFNKFISSGWPIVDFQTPACVFSQVISDGRSVSVHPHTAISMKNEMYFMPVKLALFMMFIMIVFEKCIVLSKMWKELFIEKIMNFNVIHPI